MSQGNYSYLGTLEKKPHVVANYFKLVFMEMGEPLCTYRLYDAFKNTPLQGDPVPHL
jgi:hypothetical protein